MSDPHVLTIQALSDDKVLLRVDVSLQVYGNLNNLVASALLAEAAGIASSLVDASAEILNGRKPSISSGPVGPQQTQTEGLEPTI